MKTNVLTLCVAFPLSFMGAVQAGTIVCDYVAGAQAAGVSTSQATSTRRAARARTATATSSAATDGLLRSYSFTPGTADATPQLALGDDVILHLFDDVSLTGTVSRVRADAFGSTFSVAIDGLDCATIIETPDGLMIHAQEVASNRAYTVNPSSTELSVSEYEPPAQEGDCAVESPEALDTAADTVSEVSTSENTGFETAATLIDILIVYDTGALTWVNQNGGGMTNFARAAVAKMNNVLANSGLDSLYNYRLVGVTNVTGSATDVKTGLNAVTHESTGWEGVKAYRNAVGADVVTALIDTGSASGTTGLAWSLDIDPVSSFAESAFNCCAIRSVAISCTLAHEVGHNLGAGHSNMQTSGPGPQWGSTKSYSSGFHFQGADDGKYYATIMGYDTDGVNSYSYTRAPLFSSPLLSYHGTVAGTAASNDNVRVLSETYKAASAWRDQVVPVTHGVTFSPESGSSFADTLTVTLTPGADGLAVYYTLDGTTPTTASTRYTGPLTLTEATTINAVTWDGSNLSPVYSATYHVSDLGVGLDAPQLPWASSGDVAWTFQSTNTHDTVDAVQATFTQSWQSTTLTTTVSGPAELSFWYTTYKYACTFSVKVDGESVYEDSELATDSTWQQVKISIPSGAHTIQFVFANNGGVINGNIYGYAIIDEIAFVQLIPEKTETSTEVPVPYDWLDTYYSGLSTTTEYDNAALADSDGDGFTAWQEYLCGTDPTDANSYFYATIRMVNGAPVISWSVTNDTKATYTVEGATTLAPTPDFTTPTNATHRFFRVVVTPK